MTDVIAGRYALIDPIGAGGSGTVWRSYDGRRSAYCAAKVLRQRDAGELLRFVREQSVRLSHPHIVSPYSWAAEDGTVLIASDLVSGGSLHGLIGDYGPLAEGTVVTVLRQVLAGLAAVHEADLIHRDVKPANVLVRATGTGPPHVVLTDFGLTISRRDARLTQVGMVIGTPGYLPPEVLLGGVPPDPRHDLYAVGRLALTLLHGDEPGGPGSAVLDSIRDRTLRAAIDALVCRDPAGRPPDATAAALLLTDAPADPEPRTSDGDRVDVLDQLPPLPDGWGAVGPRVPLPPGEPGRATVIDVPPTAPRSVSAVRAGSPRGSSAPPPVGSPLGPAVPVGAPAAQASGRAGPLGLPGSADSDGPGVAAPSAPPGSRRRTGRVLAVVAGVGLLVVGVVLGLRLLGGTGTEDPSNPPTSGPGTAPSSTAGGTAAPTADLQAGDACSWQQEGDRRTGTQGVVVCTLTDGAYRWRAD